MNFSDKRPLHKKTKVTDTNLLIQKDNDNIYLVRCKKCQEASFKIVDDIFRAEERKVV